MREINVFLDIAQNIFPLGFLSPNLGVLKNICIYRAQFVLSTF